MTEPRNPSDSDRPREESSDGEQWTWQRPEDGSPVYGDGSPDPQSPPPPREGDQPWDPSQQGPPPDAGYEQPAGQPPTYEAPSYQPPPEGGYPPQQWPGTESAQGHYGGQPPQGPPHAYGGYDPNYQSPVKPPSGMNKGMLSLFTGIFSLILAICCCLPLVFLGFIGGIVGAVVGWSAMREARLSNRVDTPAALGFWLSIAAIILALINIILSIYIQIMHPELLTDALRDLGIG